MRKSWLILGLAAVAVFTGARAPGADAPTLATVRLELLMVSVPVADALSLVPALTDEKTAPEAFARVQKMLAQDKAVLKGWPILWLRCEPPPSNDPPRAVSETFYEMRYPTEFDPPLWPQTFGGRQHIDGAKWGPVVPKAFETRNTGHSLEADATIEADGRTIAVNLVPQIVRFLQYKEYHIQPTPLGIGGIMMQPNFWTSKVTTQLRVASDHPTLVGSFIVPEPDPHAELFILRARLTFQPPEAYAPPPAPPKQ